MVSEIYTKGACNQRAKLFSLKALHFKLVEYRHSEEVIVWISDDAAYPPSSSVTVAMDGASEWGCVRAGGIQPGYGKLQLGASMGLLQHHEARWGAAKHPLLQCGV